MADKVTVQYKAKSPNDEDISRSLAYANPNATDSQLYTATQELNSLTNNTLGDVNRVDTTQLVDESGLLDRTIRFSNVEKSTFTIAEILAMCDDAENLGYYDFRLGITGFNASSTVYPYLKENNTAFPFQVSTYKRGAIVTPHAIIALTTEQYNDYFKPTTDDETFTPPLTGTIVIAIDAGDGYKSAEITLTIAE